jgi:ABC-2 type transport system ATP-binding protein
VTAPAVEVDGAGRRFGKRWALRDCHLQIPEGRVVGLVGSNGAGKTTLLHLVVGLLEPTEGEVTVLGARPGTGDALRRVGFFPQHAPLYAGLTVAEHLELGRRLNDRWDTELAAARIERLALDPKQKGGRLSGGQRAQLALTLAMAKRPDLLVLDEPVASLDPLARRELLADVMTLVAEEGPTVILSSHLLSDVERVCDHLIVLADGRVRFAGDIDELLASHKVVTGPRRTSAPSDQEVVQVRHSGRQTTMLVRTDRPIVDPGLAVADVGLEEIVLAYMASDRPVPTGRHLDAVAS